MGKSWWRRFFPLRFYRSAACYAPHASAAWYFEWRGRGWHIEVMPNSPDMWKPDMSGIFTDEVQPAVRDQ